MFLFIFLGYPESILFTEFKNRFGVIAPADMSLENEENEQKVSENDEDWMKVSFSPDNLSLRELSIKDDKSENLKSSDTKEWLDQVDAVDSCT